MDNFSFGTLTGGFESGAGEAVFANGRPFVEFFAGTELLGHRSKEEGKPVYRKVDMIRIHQPGQRDNCVREVQDWHKQAFKAEWDAYEAGQEQVAIGTPVAVLFPANPEIAEGLKASKIHTVEQLANLTDHAVQAMGLGASEFRTRASKFLEQAEKAADFGRAEAAESALVDMKARMAKMEAELAAAKAAAPASAETPAATTPPVEPLRRKASPTAA